MSASLASALDALARPLPPSLLQHRAAQSHSRSRGHFDFLNTHSHTTPRAGCTLPVTAAAAPKAAAAMSVAAASEGRQEAMASVAAPGDGVPRGAIDVPPRLLMGPGP